MNTFIALSCLLAVLGVSHSNPVGYGLGGGILSGGLIAPAISSANLYRAAPISVIRTAAVSPIIAPAVHTVPVLKTVNVGNWGLGGIGYGGLGYGNLGYGNLGYGNLGYGLGGWGGRGHGVSGLGYGLGGWGGSKIYG